MQADPLAELRDIHLPPPPDWWPPAPGWWLLAFVALLLVALGIRSARRAWRDRAPLRSARALHARLVEQLRAGKLDALSYAHACNELLKRLFVHVFDLPEARRASSEDWLELLDRQLGEPAFSSGAGKILGEARFAAGATCDADALEMLMLRLLNIRSLGRDTGSRP